VTANYGISNGKRRLLLGAPYLCVGLAVPAILRARDSTDVATNVRRNTSSFSIHDWRDHFDSLGKGVLLSDTNGKFLQHWTSDGEMRVYPTSVPITEDLTRRGYTRVIRKVNGPSWAPTPAMKERDPEWPDFIGPGPENPLGTHALYLSWQYYRIHGTNDTRKIGRRSSNGCIGLFNEQIAEVFSRTPVGAQVKLI
jgi:L,D-transpeptidase ErfK/SrfK